MLRKQRAFLILVALGLGAALAAAQQKAAEEADVKLILALESAWNRAEQTKQAVALEQLLHSDMTYIDYDGTLMNKTEYLASITAPELHPAQITNESVAAHVYGDSAVVIGTYREQGVNKGKSYSRRGRFTDTWVKQSGTWQCVASQSTLIHGK